MTSTFVFLSLSALVLVAQGKNINNATPRVALTNYTCPGEGHFQHPESCSLYVVCDHEGTAYEVECEEGVDEFGRSQRLHFVAESGPDPLTARCADPSIARCGPEPTTTEKIDTCDEGDCQLKGYCRDYNKCVSGRWKNLVCGADLFWDPTVSVAHGGVCNYFDNLSPATQKEYLDDLNCIKPCHWWQTAAQECSAKYMYRSKFTGSTEDREQELQCPNSPVGKPKLCWSNDERLTCVRCSEAVDLNRQPCQTQIA